MINKFLKQQKGFTLIEILIVIGIIAILAAIVIVAINPAKQFAQARNTQRQAGVNSILNAVGQRMADNKGTFAGTFSAGTYTCSVIPTGTAVAITASANGTATAGDLGCLAPTYISAIPVDPNPDATLGGYNIVASATGRITVCAPSAAAENAIPDAATICVTR